MSKFKVSRERISLFKHDGADKLEIGKVGSYQVVVGKGQYKDGDTIVFAPEKSVLTGKLRDEYITWLAGPNQDRVHAIRLRGQLSCGIIIPDILLPDDVKNAPIGEDISKLLGITKYIPTIPKELDGDVEPASIDGYVKHDCEQFLVYENNFIDGERVVVTEKLHGVQMSVVLDNEQFNIMSKGLADGDMAFSLTEKNSKENMHVMVANKLGLRDIMKSLGKRVQLIGELLPSQKGYNYGLTEKTFRLFKVVLLDTLDEQLDPVYLQYDQVSDELRKLWVPVLYDGPYSKSEVLKYHKGKETVSGKELHIKEGVVVVPYIARRAKDGTKLVAKIINPDYRETGEELS